MDELDSALSAAHLVQKGEGNFQDQLLTFLGGIEAYIEDELCQEQIGIRRRLIAMAPAGEHITFSPSALPYLKKLEELHGDRFEFIIEEDGRGFDFDFAWRAQIMSSGQVDVLRGRN